MQAGVVTSISGGFILSFTFIHFFLNDYLYSYHVGVSISSNPFSFWKRILHSFFSEVTGVAVQCSQVNTRWALLEAVIGRTSLFGLVDT